MPLTYNGTQLQNVVYNGTTLSKVIVNGVTVFMKELYKLNNVTSLSVARGNLTGTTVGNYAIFAGGKVSSGDCNIVDAYNTSLTRTNPTTLSSNVSNITSTTVGNYAIFAGSTIVNTYNTSLTKTIISDVISGKPTHLASTTVGNYAIFAGGKGTNQYGMQDSSLTDVYAYNSSFTKTSCTSLTYDVYNLASTTVGNYAIFAGGYRYWVKSSGSITGNVSLNTVNVYNTSLTFSTATALTNARDSFDGTTVGNYAIFAGGKYEEKTDTSSSSSHRRDVDVYNTSLVKTTAEQLDISGSRYDTVIATTVGNYALFSGGYASRYLQIYDKSLTKREEFRLSLSDQNIYNLASATVGNYAIFAGGHYASELDSVNTVGVFAYQE